MGKALKEMGYDSLRPSQEGPVSSIMACCDTIAIMPTGAGKSLLYGLPTKALGWRTVVVSPLKALMMDQVEGLWAKGITAGVINSDNSAKKNEATGTEWMEGKLSVLFLAPESLNSPSCTKLLSRYKPDLMVFDEAHMIAIDGSSFRPDYQRCRYAVWEINPRTLLACTATATDDVMDNIKDTLGLREALVYWHYAPRTNLRLKSEFVEKADDLHYRILCKLKEIDGSVIVYVDTLKHMDQVYEYLFYNLGEEVVMFNGSMDVAAKQGAQSRFMRGEVRVIVATNAFGMGIDKPDIRGIIHAYPPGSLEAVAQETGRAARDGGDAECVMYYSNDDSTRSYMARIGNPTGPALYAAYNAVKAGTGPDGKCCKKVKDLLDPLGFPPDSGISSALPFMEARGYMRRVKSDSTTYTVTVQSRDGLTKNQCAILDAVEKVGVQSASVDGFPTWKVRLEQLQVALGTTGTTTRNNLSKLGKTGKVGVEFPFNGMVAEILKPCTRELCELAERKRKEELDNVKDVWKYCRLPDDSKQKFLDDYFELTRTEITNGNK